MNKSIIYLTIVFIFLLGSFNSHLRAQQHTEQMIELRDICLTLRENIGSDHIINQTTKRFKNFRKSNKFSANLSDINFKIIEGQDNILPLENHIIFIPEYFEKLMENNGSFYKAETLIKEWEELTMSDKRSTTGYVIYQYNFAIKKHSNVVYMVDVQPGPVEIMVVSEPNATTTMKILDVNRNLYYNDLDSDKQGKVYRHHSLKIKKPSTLKITIYNRSAKDASMAFFCLQ